MSCTLMEWLNEDFNHERVEKKLNLGGIIGGR